MIIQLKSNISESKAQDLAKEINAFCLHQTDSSILVSSYELKELPVSVVDFTEEFWNFDNDIQLASKKYRTEKRTVSIGNIQIGGKTNQTVSLKRGFGSTLKEFVQASEFILSSGNENVILCERGIRTFENNTRFTLDLCGVAWLQENVNLPIVLDPSHAMGFSFGVPSLSKAFVAMGIDGLLIEMHPNPKKAKSDASQQLNFEEFEQLWKDLQPVAQAVGYKMI